MTNEELVKLYQEGNETALKELIEQNKGIVHKLVNRFYIDGTCSIDREDLEQEGIIGLIMAAKRYDLDYINRASFITYAVYWINQKISRFLKFRNTNNEVSIYSPVPNAEDLTIEDSLQDKHNYYEAVEEKIYRQEQRKELEGVMMEALSLKEREIVKLRNGWNDNKPMTLEAIGEIFSFTRERTRQIETRSYRKMRKTLWGEKKRKEIIQEEFRLAEARKNDSFLDNLRYTEKINEIKNLYSLGILKDDFARYIAENY